MKNSKLNKIVIIGLLLLSSFTALADDIDDSNATGDVQDVVAAPINNYIPLALVAAIGLSFVFLRKKSI